MKKISNSRKLFRLSALLMLFQTEVYSANITISPCNCSSDYENIRAAINQAQYGEQVTLSPGNYKIDQTILINRPIIFQGSGYFNTTILATGAAKNFMIQVFSNNTTIRNLKLDGANLYGGGIYAQPTTSSSLENLIIDRNEFKNFKGSALSPTYTSDDVEKLKLHEYCVGKNKIGWSALAIRLDKANNTKVTNNLITNISGGENDCGGDSLGANRAILTVGGADKGAVTISDNTIRNVNGYEDGDCIDIYNAGIFKVYVTKNYLYACNKRGIKINGGNVNAIENFIYSDGDLVAQNGNASLNGIFVYGQNNLIEKNTILLKRGASGIAVTNNPISGGVGIIQNNHIDMFGTQYLDSRHGCSWSIPVPGNGCELTEVMPIRGIQFLSNENDSSIILNNLIYSNNIGIGVINKVKFDNTNAGNIILAKNSLELSSTSRTETGYLNYFRFNHPIFEAQNYPFLEKPSGKIMGEVSYSTGVIGLSLFLKNQLSSIDFTTEPDQPKKDISGMVLSSGRTLSFWVLPTVNLGTSAHPFYPGLFSQKPNGFWDNYISFNKNSDGSASIVLEDNNGQLISSDAFVYNKNKWNHIAISINQLSQASFYINGSFKGTRATRLSEIYLNYLNRGYAGALDGGGASTFFDEILLVNKVLSASEIYNENQRGMRSINR